MTTTLLELLGVARDWGFLGPGDVGFHVEHSRAFFGLLDEGATVLDLGSGGGVPGLVLVVERPDLSVTMLDANKRRTDFLGEALVTLGAGDRSAVIRGRAEEAGRDALLRGAFDQVVSRSFGPPAVVAECAAPFLRVGGRLVVSEPKDAGDVPRWDSNGLSTVGMSLGSTVRHEPATLQVIDQTSPCPEQFPRRTGVPAKRPLF